MPATARTPKSLDSLAEDLQPQLGLRERKKLKTRIAIRRATYELIASQGYEATTVEQIAEAAEVSPSTVFRYFPTKEDIVLTDEFDPLMVAELRARPADEPVLESLRHVVLMGVRLALEHDPEEMYQRTRLLVEVPVLRARMMQSISVTCGMVCEVLAERTGRGAADLEVRVYSMAVLGALHETTVYWAEHDHEDDLVDLVNRALDTVRDGM
ncbi:TetR/AcrR family transcriptional regulator [Streptomyces sp. CBMA152]|uniref:TetR/AcrR family transcriptional regulator n=1 Tax=Streptomyces sp. CBMA152 TaxID=1896312 RepID=UPI0016604C9C|nr:TetR family transcriptional regulator [Streptomyces sp. CBMA152]MBD0745352.1 TetR family transcriptional regulator [Streptomyces sp. CBMA152]